MDYESFKQEFNDLSGIQLDFYKEKQMKRRTGTYIGRKGKSGYLDFFRLIEADPSELASFIDYITINVTEFFRTPEQWDQFVDDALATLMQGKQDEIRIWSCACSTGEEPYSLAMSVARMPKTARVRIIASDIDDGAIAKAKKGVYSAKSLEKLPRELIEEYFVETDEGLSVTDEIKSLVEFRKIDLFKDEYPPDCDIIVCRNVLIYFTEEGKERIYAAFKKSLKPNGYLFTGNAEQIVNCKRLDFRKIRNFLYQSE